MAAAPEKSVVIVGANRGIGLKLAQALAGDWTVTGSVRPQTLADRSTRELEETGAKVLTMDLTDEETIIAAAKAYGVGPLDMLINCAGVGPDIDSSWYGHTAEILMEKIRVNTIGPFLTSKHFHPNLKLAAGKIINVSSRLGSIGGNKGGLRLGYRISKAAQNQLTVTLAAELANDNIAVIALSPGFVATRLTGFTKVNEMDECIAGIIEVIEGIDMRNTGTFVNWKNEIVPW